MCDDPRALEERGWSDSFGTVDYLVGDYEISGLDFFAEGAHCAECEDDFYTEGFESGDVGAGGDVGGVDSVPYSMSS